MAKLNPYQCFTLYLLAHASFVFGQGSEPVETWFERIKTPRIVPKAEIIRFYVQDLLGGPAQTVWPIAQASITPTSPTTYGRLFMSDDLLTVGPDINSQRVGRAQGLVGFCDLNEVALYLSVNFLFTSGKYNGSTISVLGRNALTQDRRELSVVGGTGYFRLARGIAIVTTFQDFNATGYAVFKYTLYVIFP